MVVDLSRDFSGFQLRENWQQLLSNSLGGVVDRLRDHWRSAKTRTLIVVFKAGQKLRPRFIKAELVCKVALQTKEQKRQLETPDLASLSCNEIFDLYKKGSDIFHDISRRPFNPLDSDYLRFEMEQKKKTLVELVPDWTKIAFKAYEDVDYLSDEELEELELHEYMELVEDFVVNVKFKDGTREYLARFDKEYEDKTAIEKVASSVISAIKELAELRFWLAQPGFAELLFA